MRPEGLTYRADLVTEAEERALLEILEDLPFEPVRMRGGIGKRETIHFGWAYDYEGWTIRPAPPPPAALEPLLHRCAELAGVARAALQQVMVARYPPSATIGWHRDAPMFGSPVIGVSLGTPCEMRFRRALAPRGDAARRKFETYALLLEPRSLYILDGPAVLGDDADAEERRRAPQAPVTPGRAGGGTSRVRRRPACPLTCA